MNYLKHGVGTSRPHDEAMLIGTPRTPRSELQYNARGALISSLQEVRGLCAESKCVRKAEHEGECWPK